MTRAITKKELYDEDWQTQLARGYENIPANTIVEVLGNVNNLYGSYTKVLYNGILYYVKPEDLSYNTKKIYIM